MKEEKIASTLSSIFEWFMLCEWNIKEYHSACGWPNLIFVNSV